MNKAFEEFQAANAGCCGLVPSWVKVVAQAAGMNIGQFEDTTHV